MKDWLTHRARTSPGKVGLVAAETGEEWSYAALDEAVDELAGRLVGLGVRAGDHVGTLVGTRPVAVELVHAVMRLGAVLVPLNRRLTVQELGEQVRVSGLTVLVCDGETEDRADEAAGAVPVASVDDPERTAVARLEDWSPKAVSPADWEHDDTLALLFTSGTTGTPKAVTLTMGNVFSSAVASAFRLGVTPGDRWLVALSLYHMGGLAPLYRSTLYGSVVVLRGEFEPGAAADDIGTYDVTGVSLVPTMLTRMLDSRGTLAASLRFVLLGGAPATEELVRRCRDYSVPVHPTYGMTETASQIATALPEEAFEHPGTVGRPLLWTELTVVDDAGDPLPAGESGELVVSGPTVTPGYYGDQAATEAAFGPHGLRTGDVGHVDEAGRVYVSNRLDDRIVTGGENVDPGEVVGALRAHPGVADAAVVGLPDETWGERVAALVVPSDPELTAEDVTAHCRERIAGYKLPRTVGFADELPRTASGTVSREAVREALLSLGEGEEAEATEETESGVDVIEVAEAESRDADDVEPNGREDATGDGDDVSSDIDDGGTGGGGTDGGGIDDRRPGDGDDDDAGSGHDGDRSDEYGDGDDDGGDDPLDAVDRAEGASTGDSRADEPSDET
ncbi:o-succinylbenzoate--CoA ligase [Halobium salinum]|uniref:2-succinylbenzoate--CoA ligase n=1 Tax=Halobium salinum TaxID=1364940 RepID=A0ABD5P6Q8_9EURY|nr:o-succinylbenzoate--CoA ligase [Halobium salinum]